MNVRLSHLDGKLPNLALMKLAHWHKAQGDTVSLVRGAAAIERGLYEPDYGRVYASTIFKFSNRNLERFRREWPGAIVGGTGSDSKATIEEMTGDYEHYEYSIYPDYKFSLGFTQRGCRLRCGFCVVPEKEGRPRSVNTINSIWRGDGFPRAVSLLDNDFFGQPKDQWKARAKELMDGDFMVSLTQGINVRLIDEESAGVLAGLRYYDDQFKTRRLYTAWDSIKDEGIFMRGIGMLLNAGIKPHHIMVYMLIGYDPAETMEAIMYRFEKMVAIGLLPYPMVYNNADPDLKWFQRWVIMRSYKFIPWAEFTKSKRKTFYAEQKIGADQASLL